MKVAVMFSGGKDSTMALNYALSQGWDVETLISVKPKSTESFLYQYSTVEWTRLTSEALGIPVIHVKSEKIGPKEEADELEEVFKNLKVDAILMGGVGLQETQIRELKRVAQKFGIDIIVPYENLTSEELFDKTINSGFDIMMTDVATDGLGPEWLGKKLDKETAGEFKKLSKKFGFDVLGEGGYYNTFVVNGPKFKKKIEVISSRKIWDNKTSSGYLEIEEAKLVPK
ncbi:MAG: diphthine--ammonia ligase [Candidatus Aenigmarchaeota archaeon]|nr:diphthine--ammonia ligase [Candidatus Aenigmarchaeota archaeon]